jgi:hypothetical protein
VLVKRTLPPPTPVVVYELTEAGEALAPVIAHLRARGERFAPSPTPADAVRPAWIVQGAAAHDPSLLKGRVCELRVGNDVFELTGGEHDLAVNARASANPDAVLTIEPRVLMDLASGRIEPGRGHRQIDIDGDRELARDVISMLAGSVRFGH